MKRILQGIVVVLALGAMAQTIGQANEKQKENNGSIKESAPKENGGKKGGGGNDPTRPTAQGEPGI